MCLQLRRDSFTCRTKSSFFRWKCQFAMLIDLFSSIEEIESVLSEVNCAASSPTLDDHLLSTLFISLQCFQVVRNFMYLSKQLGLSISSIFCNTYCMPISENGLGSGFESQCVKKGVLYIFHVCYFQCSLHLRVSYPIQEILQEWYFLNVARSGC